jgi:hypothetical protein
METIPSSPRTEAHPGTRSARHQHGTERSDRMPELDTKAREDLDRDQFAYVDRDGGEHLPIHDASHVRNAISRFSQTDFQSDNAKQEAAKKIMRAVKRLSIDVDEDSDVVKAAR